jgi:mannose-6-phosphate isomerase-like protein (cupin superfamily)
MTEGERAELCEHHGWEHLGTVAPVNLGHALPTIIDVHAEATKLMMFRGRTPTTTFAERKGTAVQLGTFRDEMLLLGKSAGIGHWETHPEDEMLYVVDGAMTVDIVERDSVGVSAGMMCIVPPSTWHRVRSTDGATVMSAVIPGDHLDRDIDDPRTVERQPGR